MERLLQREGRLFKHLKGFVLQQSERIKEHARNLAEESARPYEYYVGPIAKDKRAREIAERDGVREGLVCVIAAVESCRSFRLAYGEGRPRILPARRKCLFLYYYFIDPVLGFLHVRIQTWFPLTIQVYVNGHEWLARQLDARGIGYRRLENAFLSIDDPAAAKARLGAARRDRHQQPLRVQGPSYRHPARPRSRQRVSRILERLHVRNLIAKIPRSHRWRVTRLGHDLMAAALHVRDAHFVQALSQPAPA